MVSPTKFERYSVKPGPRVRASRPLTQSVASKWPIPPTYPYVAETLQLQTHGMLLPVLSIQTVSLSSRRVTSGHVLPYAAR